MNTKEIEKQIDSRKALEMYLECQEIDSKLRATFGQNTLAKLKALFEDY